MYINKINKNEDMKEVKSFIHQNGFATLVNQVEGRPWATHLPLLMEERSEGEWVLVGHLAKANPQWRTFAEQPLVLAIFAGAHTYISSSWYDHPNVPTWNYVAVHVYGKVRVVKETALMDGLKKLVDKYEEGRKNRVSLEGLPEDLVRVDVRGLVAFEIDITEVQASHKLSQNRNEENYKNIIRHLKDEKDENAQKIAAEMEEKASWKKP